MEMTKRLISDEETIREMDWVEMSIEYANAEGAWRKKTDYKAGERASELNAKLWDLWCSGDWLDRRTMALSYSQWRLRLLYKHGAEA